MYQRCYVVVCCDNSGTSFFYSAYFDNSPCSCVHWVLWQLSYGFLAEGVLPTLLLVVNS
jgi:hypothetical protein